MLSTKAECVQQLVCPSAGSGLVNQCNLSQLKPLFPRVCSVLSLGASPRAEKSFLYWLSVVRLSHLGSLDGICMQIVSMYEKCMNIPSGVN